MSLLSNSELDRDIIDSDNESEQDHIEVSDSKKETIMIKNPFFSRDKIIVDNYISKILNLNQKEIISNFNSIYVICQKNNGFIKDNFYDEEISIYDLENFINNLTIIEGNFKMLYNPVHKSACVVINNTYLSLFKSDIEFENSELVLPLINLSENNVRLYLKQFNGIYTVKDYITTKVVNQFYKNTSSSVAHFSINLINSMEESCYWSKRFNTKLNITNKFINRGFNLTLNQRVKNTDLKSILQEVNEIPREGDNYFGFLYKKKKYVDIASSIKKNGYTLYRISDSADSLNNKDLDYLLDNCQNNYECYKLVCCLLISKDYCHLILNDINKLVKLINGEYYDQRYEQVNIFKKYILAFKYAIGYSWLTFYTEESIKKSRIIDEDRFVFSIDTASKLFCFPLHYENIHDNPYLPILISREIIDINNNCVGVDATHGIDSFGVVSLDKFRNNFNIFLCGDCKINLLEGLNWNNIGISGSIIPACITKYNPLEKQFNSKNRFFNEYYCDSDIDVMCNLQDPFQYIDKAYEFYNLIVENCQKLNSHRFHKRMILMKDIKSVALIVNESFIRKNIINIDNKYSYDYIFTHLDDIEIKKRFYEFYVDWKIKENEKFMQSNQWRDEKYNHFFEIIPVENIIIIFARTKSDWEKYWTDIDTNKDKLNCLEDDLHELEKDYFCSSDIDSDEMQDEIDNDNILFKCHENLKFKISSKYLNHDFEFFKTRYEGSFFSTVSQFHLPCVRGFYNGVDVKLLPSCISAAMTLINIDYKYFAGSKDPIEIINKYRMRGYTTLLNDSERIRLVSYSNKVEKWDKLYGGILKSSNDSINSIFGPKPISYSLFKPRHVNKELYSENKPVDINYRYCEVNKKPLSEENYGVLDLEKRRDAMVFMNELTTIGSFGYVNPVKKWYFDAIYENF